MVGSEYETPSFEEQFQVLFAGNVAGTILTTPEGEIVDCNQEFVRMFGFDSRGQVLAGTEWDLYFDRADREALSPPPRVIENPIAEEIILRHRSGAPMRVRITRMVIPGATNRPELVLSTLIDLTPQERLEREVRRLTKNVLDLPDWLSRDEPDVSSFCEEPKLVPIFAELAILLRRINDALRPDKLGLVGKAEAQAVVLIVERMKVLVEKLEIVKLTSERKQRPS
jgi:PAS domain S-box-containing protein